jgi:hypothetical protein
MSGAQFEIGPMFECSVVGLSADGVERVVEIDEIVVATGQRPDLTMT